MEPQNKPGQVTKTPIADYSKFTGVCNVVPVEKSYFRNEPKVHYVSSNLFLDFSFFKRVCDPFNHHFENFEFEYFQSTTNSGNMQCLTEPYPSGSSISNVDSKGIQNLMLDLKEQLTITDGMHKNRSEEMRIQQETVFSEIMNEKNEMILNLELELEDLKVKLKERVDEFEYNYQNEFSMVRKELQQLREILKIKQSQINQLKQELIQATEHIEDLEMEKERTTNKTLPIASINEEELNNHLKIITKALRSKQKLKKFIESVTEWIRNILTILIELLKFIENNHFPAGKLF